MILNNKGGGEREGKKSNTIVKNNETEKAY